MADPILAGALDFFQFLIGLPKQAYINFTRNSVEMWDGMTPLKYLRLVAILGGYLFLRPYLQKWGERTQAKQHEKQLAKAEMDAAAAGDGGKAKLSPNALRGGASGKSVKFADEGAESEGEAEGTGAEWGKKARKRQRKFVEKVLEQDEERRRAEDGDEGDKDIFEHLVDYEEGEDGW